MINNSRMFYNVMCSHPYLFLFRSVFKQIHKRPLKDTAEMKIKTGLQWSTAKCFLLAEQTGKPMFYIRPLAH